ncbi:MAG TPA: hypothetical protein VN257_11495, partial [Actinotalea sp.]|nr:hypothetical protein [Actinotalea sp.]
MRRRADLSVEVTLEEDDGSALGDGPTPDDGMWAAARRLLSARSGRTVLVAGIVLLLVGVGVTRVTAVLSERRDADALAAAASLPGIAPSLEDPLGESWRSQA